MRIAINKLHYPVTTLGPGERIGIWVQGCSIHCPGCLSLDTWDRGEETIEIDELVTFLTEHWLPGANGISITGGEPLDQPEAVRDLIQDLRDHDNDKDILLYSGYEFPEIAVDHPWVAEEVDALISGPFQIDTPQTHPLAGSGNQELHLFSKLGRERFSSTPPQPTLDLAWDGNTAWMAGVPEDWARLRSSLNNHPEL